MRSYLAYGPFLAVAGIVAVVWAEGLLGWYLR
jgi:prepilin signal peptidase PulO-like enzyme (type II secretory pathway)